MTRLLESQGPRINALALRLCRNRADAEDLVQDVFLQAFRRWHTYRGDGEVGAWLATIARRAWARRARRTRGGTGRVPHFSQLLPWAETSVSAVVADGRRSTAAEEAQRRDAVASIQRAIAELPEHFRVPLVLKEVMGMSLTDTAKFLGIKEETVKTRLHRARLLLRQVLQSTTKRVPAADPIYDKQVCLDLLKAKLAAMDSGRDASIGVTQSELCERCRTVFAELDLVQDACATLAGVAVPAALRERILRAVALRDAGAGRASPSRRGRPPVRAGQRSEGLGTH